MAKDERSTYMSDEMSLSEARTIVDNPGAYAEATWCAAHTRLEREQAEGRARRRASK